jgi:hypothetical protein
MLKPKMLLGTLFAAMMIPIVVQAKDPNVKAYCNNIWKETQPGWSNVASQHGVTIINKTPFALVYDVYFDNAIQYPKAREMPLDYSDAPFIPNAHQEYHFKIESGQTFYYGEVEIQKLAGFPRKGRHKTQATTIIKYNGVLLDNCIHYNNIDVV